MRNVFRKSTRHIEDGRENMGKPNSYKEAIELAKRISSRQQTSPMLTAFAGAYYQFGGFTNEKHLRKEMEELMDALGIAKEKN